MDNNLSELVFILDMSGSMLNLTEDTIGGYNSLLKEQRKQDGEAKITTVLFDDRYIMLHDGVDIKNVKDITKKEYCPRGMTAMLDAVGRTISKIDQKITRMPEEKRPGNVIVTIITDGYENASCEYTWKSVQSMIKEHRENHNWIFTFIGANIDTKEVSERMGINKDLARTYTPSKKGTESVYKAVSNSVKYSREFSHSAISRDEMDERLSECLDDIE